MSVLIASDLKKKKKIFQKEAIGYKTQSKCPPTLDLPGHWGRTLTGL